MNDVGAQEIEFFDEVTALAEKLAGKSAQIAGAFSDPKMMSNMLYWRLWNHHRAYRALWDVCLFLDADIVLRAALEAAICLAANRKLLGEFADIVRQDATATIKGQVKALVALKDPKAKKAIDQGNKTLHNMEGRPGNTVPAKRIELAMLADKAGVQHLYWLHRELSGVSSHVTGLSLMRSVKTPAIEDTQDRLNSHQKNHNFMLLANATLTGAFAHASLLEDRETLADLSYLMTKALFLKLELHLSED